MHWNKFERKNIYVQWKFFVLQNMKDVSYRKVKTSCGIGGSRKHQLSQVQVQPPKSESVISPNQHNHLLRYNARNVWGIVLAFAWVPIPISSIISFFGQIWCYLLNFCDYFVCSSALELSRFTKIQLDAQTRQAYCQQKSLDLLALFETRCINVIILSAPIILPSKSNCIQQKSSEFNLGALFGNAVSSSFNTMFGRDCRGRPQGDYFYGCQVKNLWKLSQFKRLGFENYILFLQCVGPFGVGRKKRSPLFLNSNQVPRDQKSLSFCFD